MGEWDMLEFLTDTLSREEEIAYVSDPELRLINGVMRTGLVVVMDDASEFFIVVNEVTS